MRILIIENNNKLAGKLKRLAAKMHYESVLIEEGEEGVDEAQSGIYDAVIIDTELPDCSGFDVLKRIRKAKVSTPILMLSPKCGVSDKVLGLESGADDFMEKPFADDELLARLHAITRRKGELILDNRLHFSELSLDMGTYEMAAGDEYIKLSNKEFELMKYFIMNGRNIINKEDLLVRLWGFENMTAENNLEVYISYLRRKLLKLGSRIQIFCVKNVGYRLLDPQLEHVYTEN
jgi:DNA-binding response OmpR family regulator